MPAPLTIDQLVGPIYYRVLVSRQPVPSRFTDTLVSRYLGARALVDSSRVSQNSRVEST